MVKIAQSGEKQAMRQPAEAALCFPQCAPFGLYRKLVPMTCALHPEHLTLRLFKHTG